MKPLYHFWYKGIQKIWDEIPNYIKLSFLALLYIALT